MCLMLDQFLWGHSSRVCDIFCLEMFWVIQYSNFKCLRIFFFTFFMYFFIKNKVCLPIDRLNIEDVFVK